jgi:hypothetical protein
MTLQTLFKALVIAIPVVAPSVNFHSAKPWNTATAFYSHCIINDTSKRYKLRRYKIIIPPNTAWKWGDPKMVDTIPDSKNRDRKMTDTIGAGPWK